MARKSRKDTRYRVKEATILPAVLRYHAALYGRISVESLEKIARDTIGTQMDLLHDFAATLPDVEVMDTYIDDDITGTNFERPAYERMMNDVDSGKINCIIVKDLSRFAREHLGAGEYLEKIFPEKGVRFIAITDNIDTLNDDGGVIVPFKNVLNEIYAKDTSKKIQDNFFTMQKNGQFCGSKVPYGYVRSEENKHNFIVDEEAAAVIRKVFAMYVEEGETLIGIAKKLEREEIPCPARYAYEKNYMKTKESRNAKWTMASVSKIVRNRTYLGDMVQNKYSSLFLETGEKGSFRAEKREDWIIVVGTHEAIIDEATYVKALDRLAQNIEDRKANLNKYNEVKRFECALKGVLKCGHCGASMVGIRKFVKGEPRYYYLCPVHDSYGNARCVKKTIKMDDLNIAVFWIIKRYMETFLDAEQALEDLNHSDSANRKIMQLKLDIRNAAGEIRKTKQLKQNLYLDLSNGLIDEGDYTFFSEQYANDIVKQEKKITDFKSQIDLFSMKFNEGNEIKKVIHRFLKARKLTREMTKAFIEKIVVDNEGSLDVTLKLKNEYDDMLMRLIERRGGFQNAVEEGDCNLYPIVN